MASRAETSEAAEEEHPLPQLPLDLQLNIIQRSDAVTVVRCAATHKLLRHAILAPAFGRRLGVDPGLFLGVDPDLLLGFSFWERGSRCAIDTLRLPNAAAAGRPLVRLDDDAITGFDPVAWRDGLVVVSRLRRDSSSRTLYDLRVCNVLTGGVTASLPPISLPVNPSSSLCNMFWPWPGSHTFMLLTAGRSFELLVANMAMQTQIFSSDRWEWGPVGDTSFPQHQHLAYLCYRYFSCPAVIGRTVHWLCSRPPRGEPVAVHQRGAGYLQPEILSLDIDAAKAITRKVPRYCFSEIVYRQGCHFDTRALLASVRGQLCVFVLESNGISAWTPTDDFETTTWSRRFMLTRPELEARAALDPHQFTQLRLHSYGERSGTMIVEVTPCLFLRLDIRQDFSLARVVRLGSEESQVKNITFLCLHENHLVSLLQDMKSFPEDGPSA